MRDEQPNGKVAYRFWQRGGGYDRNFNEPESIYAEIEYLHNNPVRRGWLLVRRIGHGRRQGGTPGSGTSR